MGFIMAIGISEAICSVEYYTNTEVSAMIIGFFMPRDLLCVSTLSPSSLMKGILES